MDIEKLNEDWYREKQLAEWSSHWNSEYHKLWMSDNPNTFLWRYIERLRFDGEGIFFIPCCGNTLDMKLLYEQGFQVVGVDIYEPAILDFFRDRNLDFVKSETGGFIQYATPDGRLRVLVGDLLKVTPDLVEGPVMAVWDRGGLGSLDKSLRKGYVRAMNNLLGSHAHFLFDCLHYNDWYTEMPPKNFPPELIAELLEPHFEVELLEEESFHLQQYFQVPVAHKVYLMTFKK